MCDRQRLVGWVELIEGHVVEDESGALQPVVLVRLLGDTFRGVARHVGLELLDELFPALAGELSELLTDGEDDLAVDRRILVDLQRSCRTECVQDVDRNVCQLRLMADYECYPLWDSHDGLRNVDPFDRPIPGKRADDALTERSDEYSATLDLSNPSASGFADLAPADGPRSSRYGFLTEVVSRSAKR